MKIIPKRWYPLTLFILLSIFTNTSTQAQTDLDGIMMSKQVFCGGLMYSHSSWKNYWEGTFKRDNLNLGTVSTQMVGAVGAYGISKKINALFSLPYVKTKATAGTLSGLSGLQDVSLWLKWVPVTTAVGKGTLNLYTIGGVSFPTSNYVADFLPLSIGLRSKNAIFRGMADYQAGKWFGTASAAYIVRSNITIDRNAYYTTEMHNTNEVSMPDARQFNFRAGYRYKGIVAEAVLNNWTTLGGFDISKNNMPFPSNKMNLTSTGVNFKYETVSGLTFTGGGNQVVAGRNVGQATTFNAGLLYIINFSHQKFPSNSSFPKPAKS